MPASRFDNAPFQTPIDAQEPRWRQWFQNIWNSLQAIALPLPTGIAVGASPFVYQFVDAGQASVMVSGGTVSLIEFSRDGTTWYSVGSSTDAMIAVSQGDYIRVTYAAAPSMNLALR